MVFGWFWVVLDGFGWFHVLVTTFVYDILKRTMVVKRLCFFLAAPGDSNLKIVAKETKMLQNLRNLKVAVCPKPIAVTRNGGVRVSVSFPASHSLLIFKFQISSYF